MSEKLSSPFLSLQEEPIIHFVDHLLQQAHQQGVSDIHIEPREHSSRIRYRLDGFLYEVAHLEPHSTSRVTTRLKVLANLDISERRQPQDGHFKIITPPYQKPLDVRVSSCPTLHGEKIVLRLLDHSKFVFSLDQLGFTDAQKNLFLKKISQPQGLILVTGPTGSGKTITLYSALTSLNVNEKNILTIEDPVEIHLENINQVMINTKIGLHFATALRAFLRQDPDIIMVGEIRDLETATMAIQAAQTGHLVLSTLHTNSAAEGLTRLVSMGIAPYQLAETISLIVAQRLLRKLCAFCKQLEASYEQKWFRPNGCKHCRQGYRGRTAIFECLDLNETLTSLITQDLATSILVKTAQSEGFMTLWEAGLKKIYQGETSFAELHRVLLK